MKRDRKAYQRAYFERKNKDPKWRKRRLAMHKAYKAKAA